MFLEFAIEFNKQVSSAVCYIFFREQEKKQSNDIEKLENTLKRLSELNWHIRSYTPFSKKYGKEIIEIQENILHDMESLISGNKVIDSKDIKNLQQDYNELVRKVHAEILELGKEHKTKDYNK